MKNKINIAPMMDWTDRHCRYFLRLLTPSAQLYTEMVTAAAVRHGDQDSLLRFDPTEHPVAVQLGGSDPDLMAGAAAECGRRGYDEININVGCPSGRVQSGQFGACLMAKPELVAESFKAMRDACDVPITVKSRIGIDNNDSETFLWKFIDTLASAGCTKFIVHARIAILDGLSPKENREVPQLNYERVFRLKSAYPDLAIVLNGGLADFETIDDALANVDGVMIGRRAYHDPYFLAELEKHLNPAHELPDRRELVKRMLPYIEEQLASGGRLNRITRHMLGLFANQPGARAWRRYLSEHAHRAGAGPEVLHAALDAIPQAA